MALFDSQYGILFAGDTFYPVTLWAHEEESDFGSYRRSLKYLVGLLKQINHLCPAHNEAFMSKEMLKYESYGFE